MFTVDFDTGSSDLWVPSIACTLDSGGLVVSVLIWYLLKIIIIPIKNISKIEAQYHLYNSSESSTMEPNGGVFSIVYGDGSSVIQAHSYKTRIGDLVVENQLFAECTEFPGDVTNEPQMDGLLGLGFASIANTRANTVLDNLFAQKQIAQKVFSFYLNRFLFVRPWKQII